MNRRNVGARLQAEEGLGAELSVLFVEMSWPEKIDSSNNQSVK
jgi:hypothetical protein